VIFGTFGVIAWAKYKNYPLTPLWDILAPAIPLAQAIGRWGNWAGQELYGKPSDLPWAVEISEENRVPGFEKVETFHPTFLYESMWNIGLVVFLICATEIAGIRINLWTMGTVLIVSLLFLAISGRRAEGEDDFGNIVLKDSAEDEAGDDSADDDDADDDDATGDDGDADDDGATEAQSAKAKGSKS